jgi:capsule polysaccharide modification protein KpsS
LRADHIDPTGRLLCACITHFLSSITTTSTTLSPFTALSWTCILYNLHCDCIFQSSFSTRRLHTTPQRIVSAPLHLYAVARRLISVNTDIQVLSVRERTRSNKCLIYLWQFTDSEIRRAQHQRATRAALSLSLRRNGFESR